MSIWRTISEQLSSMGEPVLGFLSRLASAPERDPLNSVAFTIGVIALGAKMAKADGAVSPSEVAAFNQVFKVAPGEKDNVARVFDLAKQEVAGFDAYARQIARLFEGRPQILEDVIDGLFHIAKADGVVKQAELEFLKTVTAIFGLGDRFRCIRARHVRLAEDEPYAVLGVDPCIGDAELKRLYRQIVKDNHPDRRIAAGMPEEMVAIATERLAAINAAWETIAAERGL